VVRIVAIVLLSGCFYVDPFNTSPMIRAHCEFPDGRQCNDNSIVVRGERLRLVLIVSDADDNEDRSTYRWEAFACTIADGTGCMSPPFDAQHYDEELASGLDLEIPANLTADVRSISVDFEARDDRGGFDQASLVFRVEPPAPRGYRGRGVAPAP
jgi:hypothetical protein